MKIEDYARWHDHSLDYLINLNKKDNDVKFWLRRSNRDLRLDNGFWFPGSYYIVLSPYKLGDGNARVKTIALIISFDKDSLPYSYLQLQFRSEEHKSIIEFYNDLLNTLKFEKVNNGKLYRIYYKEKEIVTAINKFWFEDKKIIDDLIVKHNLEEYFFIDDKDFIKSLSKTLALRAIRENKSNDTSIDPEVLTYPEGKLQEYIKNHKSKERSRKFVAEYKYKYRNIKNCPACKINPQLIYNINGIDFFELHHIIPLSKREEEYLITEQDVILLCPSCHRAIHKIMSRNQNKIITIEEFRSNFLLTN